MDVVLTNVPRDIIGRKEERTSKTIMYSTGKGELLPPDSKNSSLKQVVRKTGLK